MLHSCFYCANFRLSCSSEESFISSLFCSAWPIVSHGRLSRKWIIPILSPFWQLQVYKRLGKKNKFSSFAKEDILHDTTYQKLKLRRSDTLLQRSRNHNNRMAPSCVCRVFVLLKSRRKRCFTFLASCKSMKICSCSFLLSESFF